MNMIYLSNILYQLFVWSVGLTVTYNPIIAWKKNCFLVFVFSISHLFSIRVMVTLEPVIRIKYTHSCDFCHLYCGCLITTAFQAVSGL